MQQKRPAASRSSNEPAPPKPPRWVAAPKLVASLGAQRKKPPPLPMTPARAQLVDALNADGRGGVANAVRAGGWLAGLSADSLMKNGTGAIRRVLPTVIDEEEIAALELATAPGA